ncbi:hypothetical protein IKE83_00680 [Candidatus Saccharibacteria bacterium]|nr:hypothetical protein [Candidatus Saccharibacteria bacterium]
MCCSEAGRSKALAFASGDYGSYDNCDDYDSSRRAGRVGLFRVRGETDGDLRGLSPLTPGRIAADFRAENFKSVLKFS